MADPRADVPHWRFPALIERQNPLEERTSSEDLCRSLESISSPGNRIDDVHLHSTIRSEVLYGLRRHEVTEDKVLVVTDPGGPLEAIADELTEHRFVLRYRTGETDDSMSGKEGTFLICSFWLVAALAIIGEEQRARDLMERLLRAARRSGSSSRSSTSTPVDTRQLSAGLFPPRRGRVQIIVAERLGEFSWAVRVCPW